MCQRNHWPLHKIHCKQSPEPVGNDKNDLSKKNLDFVCYDRLTNPSLIHRFREHFNHI
jgi:hypothetical protein